MCWLVVDAVKPGALPLDPAPAESPFPCGGLVSDSAPGRGGTWHRHQLSVGDAPPYRLHRETLQFGESQLSRFL